MGCNGSSLVAAAQVVEIRIRRGLADADDLGIERLPPMAR